MIRIGYHASHEQFAPSALLKLAVMAEQCGFQTINSSDHFRPWNTEQGESGFSFAWLGAAMQATTLPFSMVCAPGPRYHPAVLAQAFATLGELFPGRFSAALGSGEALNEQVIGDPWPSKETRNAFLLDSYRSIKRLLAGETISMDSNIKMQEAEIYSLPSVPPLLIGAAVSKETAHWMGSWADALITVHKPYEELKAVVDAFHEGGGRGKPMLLKVQLSYAQRFQEAESDAFLQWKTNVLDSQLLADLPMIADFEKAAKDVSLEDLHAAVRISTDLKQHREWLEEDISLGFSTLILHNVNQYQEQFVQDFGRDVLPYFSREVSLYKNS